MNRRFGWLALGALSAFFAVSLHGCTIIGLTAGAISDSRTPRYRELRGSEMVRVPPGSQVTVRLRDSTRLIGVYRGAVRIADEAYQPAYAAWRERHPRGDAFPEVDEPIAFDPGGSGSFRAFVATGIEVQVPGVGLTVVDPHGILVRRNGARLDLFDARDMALAGELPIATALLVRTSQGEKRIPVDRVQKIDAVVSRRGAVNGMLVGLAADVIIIAIIRTHRSGPAPSGPECDWQPYSYGLLSGAGRRGRAQP